MMLGVCTCIYIYIYMIYRQIDMDSVFVQKLKKN